MDLELVRLFVAVAEAQSFSVAARSLGMPTSSLSRAVARLEGSLGTQLLHRTTRKVALSTAGLDLYERAAAPLKSLHEALGSLPDREEEPSGTLRMTAPIDVGVELLAEITPGFVRRYPKVKLDVRLTNRRVDLVAEGFDLALRALLETPKDSSLVMRRLVNAQIHLFAAPSYLARRGTPRTPEDTQTHDLVVYREHWPWRGLGLGKHARIVSDDFMFIRRALCQGAGIGPLPTFVARAPVEAGELTRVLPKFDSGAGRFALVYPKARQVPRKVCVFRDFLVEQLAKQAHWGA